MTRLLLVLAMALAAAAWWFWPRGSGAPPWSVSGIAPGMLEGEVKRLLGRPARMRDRISGSVFASAARLLGGRPSGLYQMDFEACTDVDGGEPVMTHAAPHVLLRGTDHRVVMVAGPTLEKAGHAVVRQGVDYSDEVLRQSLGEFGETFVGDGRYLVYGTYAVVLKGQAAQRAYVFAR